MEMASASEKTTHLVVQEQEKEKEQQQEQQQEKDHKGKMKVWVAIDETEGSLYALQWALEHLSLFRHDHRQATGGEEEEDATTITVVHVQPPFQPSYTAVTVGPILFATPSMMESAKKAEEETTELTKVFKPALELCKKHMVKAETMVIKGNPKETLVEAVEQMHVDLLVIGSRGLGKIKRAFLGSVSDYCAHHAKCPVLIIRLPKSSHDHDEHDHDDDHEHEHNEE